MNRALLLVVLAACGSAPPKVRLDEAWHTCGGDYDAVTKQWTRNDVLRGRYQEVLNLYATFLSPDWRAAHAASQADDRRLTGDARDQLCAQAQADMAGPYEVELMVTTWDRRENDLDRGQHSVWHVALIDEQGHEILPLEIVKDKRPANTVKSEFPTLGDFAQAYIARFPRTTPVLGPGVHKLRLRMSSERGGVEVAWQAP